MGITKAQLEKLVIDNAIQVEAVKAGIRPTAMEDILLRGRSRFKLKDGAAVATAPDDKVIYGKDGITPQSMGEWLADLAPAAPHLFESSGGGGSQQQRTNAAGEKTLRRADFDKLDPRTQAAKMTEGFKLVD